MGGEEMNKDNIIVNNRKMVGMIDIEFIPHPSWNASNINLGPLKFPKGMSVDGDLIAIGENDKYLHCIISGTGMYYGVFKSDDPDHLYQHLKRLNTGIEVKK